MRRTLIPLLISLAVLLPAGPARAAPGDPYVVYTANTFVDGAVVLRSNPADGSLVEVSRNGPQGTLFKRPYDLALEQDGDILVADMGTPNAKDGAVVRVDPLTGRQSLVSSGGYFYDPAGIAVAPGGEIYVVDNLAPDNDGGVIRVDPHTGAQTMVSRKGMGGNLFDLPFGIAVDRDGSLVVANRMSPEQVPSNCRLLPFGSVIRVNPATGVQTMVSQLGRISWPFGVAIDADRSIVVANECPGTAGLVRLVDPLTNLLQSIITANGSDDVLTTPQRVSFDPAGNLLVTDYWAGADGDGGIVKVDPTTHGQSLLQGGDLFNHPLGIAAVVNHPPTAGLTLSPSRVAAGRAVRLDGSGSRDPDGQRLVYDWDLDGDGAFEASSGSSPAVMHAWARDGVRTVRVRVDDPHGGTAVASAAIAVDGRLPVITRPRLRARVLALRRSRLRRRPPTSTLLRFNLSEPGTIGVEVRRAREGRRRAGGACRPHAKRGRRCVTWSRARMVRHAAREGANAFRIRARGLRPGRYRVVLTALDRVGNASLPRSLPLRIVRR